MDRRRFLVIIALIALVLVLAGCSVVFEAGISGKVVTASGTGTANVQDVSVFAYTDSSLRDSDFAKFQAGTITRPSEGSGYVATTNTNANGEFTVNKVVWETKKSEFGKTADVSKLYLIFYHEDYFPAKADATIISGSTNSSNVYVKLEASKQYTTLNVTVYDVATHTAMTEACNLEYQVEGKESSDSAVVTGTSTVRISYLKDTTPDVTFKLTSPGTGWKMTDKDGALIEQLVEEDVEEGTLSVSLYMKRYDFDLPSFSGNIDGTVEPSGAYDPANSSDNVPVWLAYKATDGNYYAFKDTLVSGNRTYAAQTQAGNEVYYTHGVFSGVGSETEIVVSESTYPDITDWAAYTGKTLELELAVVLGEYDGVGQFVGTGKPFSYTPGVTSSNLGHVVPVAITVEETP